MKYIIYEVAGGGGVSRARSVARTSPKSASPINVVGCASPNTRRAVRPASSSVVTASRRSSSVAMGSLVQHLTHRGALWASGAAQAAQFVRIILRWFGVSESRAAWCFASVLQGR